MKTNLINNGQELQVKYLDFKKNLFESKQFRLVVGMATCGISSGADEVY